MVVFNNECIRESKIVSKSEFGGGDLTIIFSLDENLQINETETEVDT